LLQCSLLLDMVVSRTQIKIILHFLPLADPSWYSVEFFSNSHVLILLVCFSSDLVAIIYLFILKIRDEI